MKEIVKDSESNPLYYPTHSAHLLSFIPMKVAILPEKLGKIVFVCYRIEKMYTKRVVKKGEDNQKTNLKHSKNIIRRTELAKTIRQSHLDLKEILLERYFKVENDDLLLSALIAKPIKSLGKITLTTSWRFFLIHLEKFNGGVSLIKGYVTKEFVNFLHEYVCYGPKKEKAKKNEEGLNHMTENQILFWGKEFIPKNFIFESSTKKNDGEKEHFFGHILPKYFNQNSLQIQKKRITFL